MRLPAALTSIAVLLTATFAVAATPATETYTLPNGLTVILHPDDAQPMVTINTWFHVGSKDEAPGRTGFAHLFEHLMFMGTERVPDNQFDVLMERGGGANNASTGADRTNYYSWGPRSLLPTLLWLDADRLEALSANMTQEKLDLQREVVRNERRQSYENAPYGQVWLEMPGALYPEGHPYAHSVIGSHEDLEAAQTQDVVDFFNAWYVPNNASLVVAGDIDVEATKAEIERLFGAIPAVPIAERERLPIPARPTKDLVEVTDSSVEVPLSILAWNTAGAFQPGDAELDLVGGVLASGRSSRLYTRLVDTGVALEVSAAQYSQLHSSIFMVDFKPAEGHTVEEIEAIVLEEIARLAAEGPTEEELERVLNTYELSFVQGLESLDARASALNRYQYLVGKPDYLAQDLARYSAATNEGIQGAAAALVRDNACIFRVFPETRDAAEGGE